MRRPTFKEIATVLVLAIVLLTGCAGSQFHFRIGPEPFERDSHHRQHYSDPRTTSSFYFQNPDYSRPVWIDLRGY